MGFIKKISAPLIFLAVIGSLYVVWWALDLPSQGRLIELSRTYFEQYGLIVVFVSAILEGALLIGIYYPGSLVIFLGVMFAAGDISKIAAVIVVTTLGMLIAYTINFFLGRYGWYQILIRFGLSGELERAKEKLQKHQVKAIIGTYWHPNFAALTSTSAGILGLNFPRFAVFSVVVTICWNVFWGTLAALLGEASLAVMGIRFAIMVVLVWVVYILWKRKEIPSP